MPLKTTSDLGVRDDFVRFRKRSWLGFKHKVASSVGVVLHIKHYFSLK